MKLCSKYSELSAVVHLFDSFKAAYPEEVQGEAIKKVMFSMHSKSNKDSNTITLPEVCQMLTL
jgi:hypothetical protein